MGSNHCALNRYMRSVNAALPCTGKAKKQIYAQIRDSVEDYLFENPNADLEMLQARFGTPQQIAASCVDDQDTLLLLKKVRIKKKVLALVAGVMAAMFLMWSGYITWAARDVWDSGNGIVEASIDADQT